MKLCAERESGKRVFFPGKRVPRAVVSAGFNKFFKNPLKPQEVNFMKNVLIKIISLVLALTAVAGAVVFNSSARSYYLGDVDGNETVNAADALFVLRYSTGILKTIDKSAADANRDGKINSADALVIIQTSTGAVKPVLVKTGITSIFTTTTRKTTTATTKATTAKQTTTTAKRTTTTTKQTTTTTKQTTTTTKATTKATTRPTTTTTRPTTKATTKAPSSPMLYTASDFRYAGVIYWNGYRWTWYSQQVLPGPGLNIPGRHVDANGYVCDGNDYICLASSTLSRGTVVNTPFGKQGKVYDSGCAAGTLDVYTNW